MKPLYVVGDIHGCYDEMLTLLHEVKNDIQARGYDEGTLVFVGDYIDRGPKSYEVVDFLMKLDDFFGFKVVKLKGNHEDMFLNSYRDFMNNGGVETMKSYERNLFDKVPDDHHDFMWYLPLFYLHDVPEEGRRIVVVHAGLDPTVKLEHHSDHMLLWNRNVVGYDGEYVNNDFVVYGHTPLREVLVRKNQLGIDTACVFGGRLTCAVFDNSTQHRLIQVKSNFSYG